MSLKRVFAFALPAGLLAFAGMIAIAKASTDPEYWIQSDASVEFESLEFHEFIDASSIDSREEFRRTRAVLDHFGVPPEEDPGLRPGLARVQELQSEAGLRARLPFFDPSNLFQRFARFFTDSGGARLGMFQDRDSRELSDFNLELLSSGTAVEGSSLGHRLRTLQGMRIALDPGHMGGDLWDARTGKFVRDFRGRKLSEGVLNLQLALLLEARLRSLGAEVMLTRRALGPVAEPGDLPALQKEELRSSVFRPWFLSLIQTSMDDAGLFRRFEKSPEVRQIFSDSVESRLRYFIQREDLESRARIISNFRPDLVLVLHFDAALQTVNAGTADGTKAYVAGAFMPEEFALRTDRALLVEHLADREAWVFSRELSAGILSEIHEALGVPPDRTGGSSAVVPIQPGLFARNLLLTRKLPGRALCYLEALHYDDPHEFTALSRADYSMTIGDRTLSYSQRLVDLADAITRALNGFSAGVGDLVQRELSRVQ